MVCTCARARAHFYRENIDDANSLSAGNTSEIESEEREGEKERLMHPWRKIARALKLTITSLRATRTTMLGPRARSMISIRKKVVA